MLFYFSGTGNSLYVAKTIAQYQGEDMFSISSAINSQDEFYEYNLKDDEIIGFVFPVYAWGPPEMVLRFIEKLRLNNYQGNYIFTVVTCGDNIGNTIKVLNNSLHKKGLQLNSGFSIIMPNNYIVLGDVDSKEVEAEKLSAADESLKNINKTIGQKARGVFELKKGLLPWLLTGVINPMFNKHALDSAKFTVDDNCTSCGICEKVCNCNNIIIREKPQWGQSCSQCLACIHYCPMRAIQYGKGTKRKGRYTHPKISADEIK